MEVCLTISVAHYFSFNVPVVVQKKTAVFQDLNLFTIYCAVDTNMNMLCFLVEDKISRQACTELCGITAWWFENNSMAWYLTNSLQALTWANALYKKNSRAFRSLKGIKTLSTRQLNTQKSYIIRSVMAPVSINALYLLTSGPIWIMINALPLAV